MIRLTCPCGRCYRVASKLIGQHVQCPACGATILVAKETHGHLPVQDMADIDAGGQQTEMEDVGLRAGLRAMRLQLKQMLRNSRDSLRQLLQPLAAGLHCVRASIGAALRALFATVWQLVRVVAHSLKTAFRCVWKVGKTVVRWLWRITTWPFRMAYRLARRCTLALRPVFLYARSQIAALCRLVSGLTAAALKSAWRICKNACHLLWRLLCWTLRWLWRITTWPFRMLCRLSLRLCQMLAPPVAWLWRVCKTAAAKLTAWLWLAVSWPFLQFGYLVYWGWRRLLLALAWSARWAIVGWQWLWAWRWRLWQAFVLLARCFALAMFLLWFVLWTIISAQPEYEWQELAPLRAQSLVSWLVWWSLWMLLTGFLRRCARAMLCLCRDLGTLVVRLCRTFARLCRQFYNTCLFFLRRLCAALCALFLLLATPFILIYQFASACTLVMQRILLRIGRLLLRCWRTVSLLAAICWRALAAGCQRVWSWLCWLLGWLWRIVVRPFLQVACAIRWLARTMYAGIAWWGRWFGAVLCWLGRKFCDVVAWLHQQACAALSWLAEQLARLGQALSRLGAWLASLLLLPLRMLGLALTWVILHLLLCLRQLLIWLCWPLVQLWHAYNWLIERICAATEALLTMIESALAIIRDFCQMLGQLVLYFSPTWIGFVWYFTQGGAMGKMALVAGLLWAGILLAMITLFKPQQRKKKSGHQRNQPVQ